MSAVDNVQDTLGEASLLSELCQNHGCAGVPLRGLQNVGVSAGDGQGEHPEGNHGGEVEGADSSSNSKWLPVRVGVHVLRNGGKGFTHEKGGNGAGMLNNLCITRGRSAKKVQLSNKQQVSLTKATEDVTAGISKGLSLFQGDGFGNLLLFV